MRNRGTAIAEDGRIYLEFILLGGNFWHKSTPTISWLRRGGFMPNNMDFIDQCRTNPSSPREDLKWVLQFRKALVITLTANTIFIQILSVATTTSNTTPWLDCWIFYPALLRIVDLLLFCEVSCLTYWRLTV